MFSRVTSAILKVAAVSQCIEPSRDTGEFVGAFEDKTGFSCWHPEENCHKKNACDADLIEEWVEPKRIKGWVNLYPTSYGLEHSSDVHPRRNVGRQGDGSHLPLLRSGSDAQLCTRHSQRGGKG